MCTTSGIELNMRWKRSGVLLGMFFTGALLVLASLLVSLSDQLVATYVFALAGLTEWVLTGLAAYSSRHHASPLRPWIMRGVFTLGTSVVVVVVSWFVTDAIMKS